MEKVQRISLLAKGMGMLLSGTCRLLTGVRTRWVGCQPSMASRIYYAIIPVILMVWLFGLGCRR